MESADPERTIMFRSPVQQASAVMHVLLLRQDGAPPRRIAFGDEPINIGRDATNGVVTVSPEVSRQHCRVALTAGGAVLTDLNSTNGVYVDGHRVQGTTTLHPGARITVGPFSLMYQRGSAEDLAEAEAGERELTQAIGYIHALLPPPLREGPVRAEWRFMPSALLGGDAFGYRWLDDRVFSIFLLDVCGHGIGSALLAASAANILRTSALRVEFGDPAAVLDAMNATFPMENHHGLFISMWYGAFDRMTRRLRYASAGHHPAFLALNGGLSPLATRSPAIGTVPNQRFSSNAIDVQPGARLHLFSDGAFEVTYADGALGSLEDLLGLLERPGQGRSTPDQVLEDLRELTGRRPFEDDVSMVTLEFL